MKYLCVFLLMLVGCGKEDLYTLIGKRKFAIGDCLIVSNKEPEKWEISKPQYSVTEIGKRQYRIRFIENGPSDIYDAISFGYLFEGFFQKVPCK